MTTATLSAPAEPATTTPAKDWVVDTKQRCDRCGAQAYIRATNSRNLSLIFCGHHGRKVIDNLPKESWIIEDHTSLLTANGTRPDGGSAAG